MKEDIDGLIKLWQPEVPEPAAFKREVWRRIERGHQADSWLEGFLRWLARPKIASFAAAVAILGGALIGSMAAGQGGRVAYLHAVDPYAQVARK